MRTKDELFLWPLSKRENEVLRLVSFGLEFIEISNRLGLTPHTIRYHITNVRRKFNEMNASKHRIVAECFRTGYLNPFERLSV